jgi:dTMP kinase
VLLVLEGPEAAGKTTQLTRITSWFVASGIEHVAVREPGGTPAGDVIRQLLLDPASSLSSLSSPAEALLFMASRAELVERVIRPALDSGRTVIVDRFFLSTYAYQVHGRGLDEADVRAANHLATGGLVPDLTLLLTLPLAESRSRLSARGGPDRMEGASLDFHQRVTAAFGSFASREWQTSHRECGRIVPVDASGGEEQVFARVRQSIIDAWPGSFPGSQS